MMVEGDRKATEAFFLLHSGRHYAFTARLNMNELWVITQPQGSFISFNSWSVLVRTISIKTSSGCFWSFSVMSMLL